MRCLLLSLSENPSGFSDKGLQPAAFVIGYSPVQLPQAISRMQRILSRSEGQYNAPSGEYHGGALRKEVRLRAFVFLPDQSRTRAGSRDAIKKASAIFSRSGMMKGNTHFVSASRKVMVPLPT